MPSNLSAFPYFQEREEATPAAFNNKLSIISANIASLGSTLDLGHFQQLSIGSTPPSYLTTAAVTIEVSSAYSDYLYLVDSSAQKSSYIIGSRAGNLPEGLNIWDASAGTMIVSFSKQSVRFFQSIVGPVFDTGGDYYNAATFVGSGSTLSGIQATINQCSIDGVSRALVPASMYPYDASRISFIYTVQMVREGGRWDVYDIQAYGADVTGNSASSISNRASVQETLNAAAGQGLALISSGTCVIRHGIRVPSNTEMAGDGWRSILKFDFVNSAGSNYIQNFHYPSSRDTNIRLRSFQIVGGGTGIRSAGANKPQAILFNKVDNMFIGELKVFRAPSISINYQSCRGARIIGNQVLDSEADGITGYYGNRDIVVANNSISGVGDDGIAVQSDDGVTFGNPEAIVIVGNTIYGQSAYTSPAAGRGIALCGATSVLVEANHIESTFARGILVATSDASSAIECDRIILVGNKVRSAGSCNDGISLSEGISISSCHNIIVSGNEVSNSSGIGLKLSAVQHATIVGNSIVSNGRRIDPDSFGIAVSTSTSSFILIANNIIRNNAAAGIGLHYSATVLVQGNSIVDNGRTGDGTNNYASGIYVENGNICNQVLSISHNYITDTKPAGSKLQSYGIRSAGGASHQTLYIDHNYLSGNSGAGVFISVPPTLQPASLFQYANFTLESSRDNIIGWFSPSAFTGGNALLPGMSFASEVSLGLFLSAASSMAVSYGTFDLQRALTSFGTSAFTSGTAINPGVAFASEQSLGWFRSASSHMDLSYGTLQLTNVLVRAQANSGTLPQFRWWAGSGQNAQFSLGRSASDLNLVVANSNGAFFSNTRGNDVGITSASATTFHLGIGSALPHISLGTNGGVNWTHLNQTRLVSLRTLAASSVTASAVNTNVSKDEIVFTIGGASGASLIISSGGTAYIFHSAASAILA